VTPFAATAITHGTRLHFLSPAEHRRNALGFRLINHRLGSRVDTLLLFFLFFTHRKALLVTNDPARLKRRLPEMRYRSPKKLTDTLWDFWASM
jgi:hypothetical protein